MFLGNLFEKPVPAKIGSEQVYKEGRFHVVKLQIRKGEELKPHHSATDAFLVVVEGEIMFTLMLDEFHLKRGDMLSFGSMQTHSVKAMQDSTILLVK